MSAEDLDFAAEMRALGVRKQGRSTRAPRKAGVHKSTPQRRQSTAAAVSRKGPKTVAAPSRAVSVHAPSRARPVELVEHELKRANAELGQLRLALAESKRKQHELAQALQSETQAAQRRCEQIAVLETDLRTQEASLSRVRNSISRPATPKGPRPRLADALSKRGVLGADEQARVLIGLAQAGRVGDMIDLLAPVDAEEFAFWLDEHTVLLGDCEHCPPPGRRTVLRVPRSRCEVCGGSDIKRSVRHFVDACLNNGTTRITIVGGSPKYHRQLRDLIQHRSIKLRLVPGDIRRSLRQARDDLRGSHLVIVWGGSVLDHATSEPYTQQAKQGNLLTVHHRGITMMLNAVVEQLDPGVHHRGR